MTENSPTPSESTPGEINKQYAPAEVEQRRYEQWVSAGLFRADAAGDKPPYSIVLPPPNVTGSLHIGHALDPVVFYVSLGLIEEIGDFVSVHRMPRHRGMSPRIKSRRPTRYD